MRQSYLLALLSIFLFTNAAAQEETVFPASLQKKKLRHTVGVQMNELIRQVFNFNNSNTNPANNNPYLLTYSVNSVRTGYGLRLGVGYSYQNFGEEDAVNTRHTDLNVLSIRFGVEKAFTLSPRWSAGAGIDGVYNYDDNRTETTTRAFDTTVIATNSLVHSYGGGAMAWLRYRVSDRVLIGTETSFYYSSGNQNQKIEVTARATNIPGRPILTTTTITDNRNKNGIFSVPVAFYLMVRF